MMGKRSKNQTSNIEANAETQAACATVSCVQKFTERACKFLEGEADMEEFAILQDKFNRLVLRLDPSMEDDEEDLHELMVRLKFKVNGPHRKDFHSTEISKPQRRFKLPPIELKTFSGDLKEWLGFWNQFSKIHSDDNLDAGDKFQYLLQATQGKARQLVESYPASSENYERAVESLRERFADPNNLIEYYVSELLSLVLSADSMLLSDLYNRIELQIRALDTLGVASGSYAAFLYPLVSRTLPEDVLKYWARTSGNSNNLDNLMQFLKKEVEAEERLQRSQNSLKVSAPFQVPSDDGTPATAAALFNTTKPSDQVKSKCIFCDKSNHSSENCYRARELDVSERKMVVMKARGCFICLRRNHLAAECRSKVPCFNCKRKHHVILCVSMNKGNNRDLRDRDVRKKSENIDTNKNTVNSLAAVKSLNRTTLLQTLMVVAEGSGNKTKRCRVLLDSGCQRSYVLSDIAKELCAAKRGSSVLVHSLFGGVKTEETLHNKYQFKLRNVLNNYCVEIELLSEKSLVNNVPRVQIKDIPDLWSKGIELSDVGEDCPQIDIILGADCMALIMTGKVVHLNSLVAMETLLGWTIMGNLKRAINDVNTVCLLSVSELWDLETLGIKDPIVVEDKSLMHAKAVKDFQSRIIFNEEGRYEVGLPWLKERVLLQNNVSVAEKRLLNVTRRLKLSGQYNNYDKILTTWLETGIIEEVKGISVGEGQFYLPHRPVFKDSKTTPIRPVFDAGCAGSNGVSLNNCLITGVNLIEEIPRILLRFRLGKIGVTADIKKAFLQISVKDVDRDSLRFLWWNNEEEIITLRHKKLVFGLTCSPFVLAAVLDLHLSKPHSNLTGCAEMLRTSLYCDNIVCSVDSEADLDKFKEDATNLMAAARFELQEWADSSNQSNVSDNSCVPLLGLKWDTVTDKLFCEIGNYVFTDDFIITKRKLLSMVHKLFDPLGILSAVTLIPKLLFRQCIDLKVHWDSALPKDIENKFKVWASSVHVLKGVKIDRYFGAAVSGESTSVHIFCDASVEAYSACVFMRIEDQGEVRLNFVMSKSRLAPKDKTGNIPRLELLGACIAARLGAYVRKALNLNEDVQFFYWTDSMVVYYWIQNSKPKDVFVTNRIKEILSLTNCRQWSHIDGKSNPADLPSRGCLPRDYVLSKWWIGPEWLKNWKCEPVNVPTGETFVLVNVETNEPPFGFFKFSSFRKNVRVIAWILRFIHRIQNKTQFPSGLSVEELEAAETTVWKLVQSQANSEFERFHCKTDENGVIRVVTKITEADFEESFKYPILLPSKHKIVEMLVYDYHQRFGHVGTSTLLTKIREKFWICKARRIVRLVTSSCIRCKRFVARSFQTDNAPLPLDRVSTSKIFETSGVDLCGPLFLRDGKKYWVVLFTCAVFRGVHLELTPSLSTEAFILAVRRFMARRGQVKKFYSDNGTNMVGLNNLFKTIDFSQIEKSFQIKWQFIPPSSPWWGGWWERLVRLLKELLRRNLGNSKLSLDELTTLVCECENLMNARPLTYLSDMPNLAPLTPSLFLQDLGSADCIQLDLAERGKYIQNLREALRSRFRKEYLSQLVHMKKIRKGPEIMVGEIVLIGDDNVKRIHWPLGKVVELFPGKDGIVRAAKVKLERGFLTRPVQRLFPLELNRVPQVLVQYLPEPESEMVPEEEPSTPIVTNRRGRMIKPPSKLDL